MCVSVEQSPACSCGVDYPTLIPAVYMSSSDPVSRLPVFFLQYAGLPHSCMSLFSQFVSSPCQLTFFTTVSQPIGLSVLSLSVTQSVYSQPVCFRACLSPSLSVFQPVCLQGTG